MLLIAESGTTLDAADASNAVAPSRESRRRAAMLLDDLGGLVGLARHGAWSSGSPPGVDELSLARLEAAIEIARRVSRQGALARAVHLPTPDHVARWARSTLRWLTHEEIWLVALDARHGLIGVRRAAQGGDIGCATTSRDLLKIALRLGAAAFVLVHNHPSGDPSPSVDDARMTVEVARAAALVGLPLLDHVIIGIDSHVSMNDLGLLDGVPGTPTRPTTVMSPRASSGSRKQGWLFDRTR
jgi:DNA repair protein RadC